MTRLAIGLLAALALASCSNRFDHGGRSGGTDTGADGDTDTETGTDTDTDTDADTDTGTGTDQEVDCSGCTDPECLGSVSGRVLHWDDEPFTGNVQICGSNCVPVPCDEDGEFHHVMPGGCFGFDPDGSLTPDLSLMPEEDFTKYAAALMPPYYEIDNDYHIESGTHYYVPLTGPAATYTASGGADVDLAGVSFTVEPGALGEDQLELHVLEFPLDVWTPPFVLDSMNIDALYYLSPHFLGVAEGQEIVLHVDPTAAGWSDGDSGDLYRQGDFLMGDHLVCDDEQIHIGDFVPCGTAALSSGEIVTSPIDRLTWIGLTQGPDEGGSTPQLPR